MDDWDAIIPAKTTWDTNKGTSGIGRGRATNSDTNGNLPGHMNDLKLKDDDWNVPLGQSIAGGWGTEATPTSVVRNEEQQPRGGGWGDNNQRSTQSSDRRMTCHKCNEEGHMSRDCPSGGGGGNKCFNCQEDGHMSRDCPNPKKERDNGGGGKCYNCQEDGHMSRDCPNPKKERDNGGGNKCYNCQEDGHMSRECPNPRKERSGTTSAMGGNAPPGACFRCHSSEHSVADCTEPNLGPDGKPREKYVPEEISDLYGSGISTGTNFLNFDRTPLRVTGKDAPAPIKSFDDAKLRDLVMENIKKSGYVAPTPVQKGTIPVVLQRRDLIASAITGSGKTAAFLIPVVNILLDKKTDGATMNSLQSPEVVIVAPTRELAIQIYNETRKFANNSVLKSVILYGGTVVSHQLGNIQRGCNILVATPGRLKDFVERGVVDFAKVLFFILDEADRMLDMGFGPDIELIAKHPTMTPVGKRQTLMFSATFPNDVQTLAQSYLHDYIFVNTGVVGGTNPDVEQEIIEVTRREKKDKLVEVLGSIGDARTIVFVDSKVNADFIATILCKKNFQATSIHGDRLQSQRESALRELKSGIRSILVATNVAARGLDIAGVEYVINYDLPMDMEEYVHRIGRTGRVGNVGKSISFYDPGFDSSKAGKLTELLVAVNATVPSFLESASAGMGGYNPSGQPEFASQDMRRFGKSEPEPTAAEQGWD